MTPLIVIGGLVLLASAFKTTKRSGATTIPALPEELKEVDAFCREAGGVVREVTDVNGDTYYLCEFPNGTAVDAEAFFAGEDLPMCPFDMVWDADGELCRPTQIRPVPTWSDEELEWHDANYDKCAGLLDEWRAEQPESYFLRPEVAANLRIIFAGLAKDFDDPAELADVGMVHVAPACNFPALNDYLTSMPNTAAIYHMEDVGKILDVYGSVFKIAAETLKDHYGELPAADDEETAAATEDEGSVCPPGYFYDALHDVCCPDGYHFDPVDQLCRPEGFAGQQHGSRSSGRRRQNVDAIRFRGALAGASR